MRLMGLRRLLGIDEAARAPCGIQRVGGQRGGFDGEARADVALAALLHNIPLRFGMNSWSSFAAERSAQLSALQSAASALRSRTACGAEQLDRARGCVCGV